MQTLLLLFLIATALVVVAWLWFAEDPSRARPARPAESMRPPPPAAAPAPAAREEIRESDREALRELLERERK